MKSLNLCRLNRQKVLFTARSSSRFNKGRFIALPKTTKSNKKPSEAQAKALKLINKGYRITADKTFFEKDDSRESCNWDSVVALFRRYGIEYIPEGLVKSL